MISYSLPQIIILTLHGNQHSLVFINRKSNRFKQIINITSPIIKNTSLLCLSPHRTHHLHPRHLGHLHFHHRTRSTSILHAHILEKYHEERVQNIRRSLLRHLLPGRQKLRIKFWYGRQKTKTETQNARSKIAN